MTAYLDSIFYSRPNRFYDIEEIFQPWIASKQNACVSIEPMEESIVEPEKTQESIVEQVENKKEQIRFANPLMNRDSLFWCYFYHIYDSKTISIELRSEQAIMNVAMNEKIKISEFLKTNASLLKKTNYKITNSQINEIQCDLMVKPMLHGDLFHLPFVVMHHLIVYLIPESKNGNSPRAYKQFYSLCDEPDEDESNVLFLRYCKNERGKPQYRIQNLSPEEKKIKRKELKQSWTDITKLGSMNSKKKEELIEFYQSVYPNAEELSPKITKQELIDKIEPIYRLFT